jgi:hypothetical protein
VWQKPLLRQTFSFWVEETQKLDENQKTHYRPKRNVVDPKTSSTHYCPPKRNVVDQKMSSTHYCPKRSGSVVIPRIENRRLVVVIVIVEWQHVDPLRAGRTSVPIVVVVDEAVVGLAVVGEKLKAGSRLARVAIVSSRRLLGNLIDPWWGNWRGLGMIVFFKVIDK